MPLESCMILLDNSEFMRNGDYVPTRLDAQSDAANMIVNQKTQSNPESTVGVISMSSTGPASGAELLVSPTDDLGKILSALHRVPLCGKMVGAGRDAVDVAASVQVATLALKHRRNKNGSQRIVLFVGSPLSCADSRSLVKAGKQLKKNNVFIDVIVLGELEENEPKLRALVDAANGATNNDADATERNCHLVTIPAGVLPSDVLISSPILRGDGGASMAGAMGSSGGGGGDAFAEYGGIDPNMDPELAMVLRVSMEEERARQERAAAAAAVAANEGKENEEQKTSGGDGASDAANSNMEDMSDEDALLQQALAMSMAENQAVSNSEDAAGSNEDTAMDIGDDDEDAAMQMALHMSMQGEENTSDGAAGSQFQDPAFVSNLLGSLPGVNPDDPAIQEALRKANEDADKKDKDKK